jgi:hypothetical protein
MNDLCILGFEHDHHPMDSLFETEAGCGKSLLQKVITIIDYD